MMNNCRKKIAVIVVLALSLALCACSADNNTAGSIKAPTTAPADDYSITTASEAREVAEKYLKETLPKLCSGYEYSTGRTQLWGWNTRNYMIPSANGWMGTLSGSFQLIFYGSIEDVDFSAQVEIDNTTGTIRLLDVDIDD